MKNWKTQTAFFVFVISYIYSLITGKEAVIVETTGTFALIAMCFMMIRTNVLSKILTNLSENWKNK